MALKVVRIAFTLFVMAFITVLVVMAFGYDRSSALLPILVGFSCLGLAGLSLATDLFPKINSLFVTGFFSIEGARKDTPGLSGLRFGLMSFWLVLLSLLIFFFGFLRSLPVWVFAYIVFQGRRPRLQALIVSVAFWLFLYGFFVRIMSLDLFQGLLFGGRIG